MHITLTDREWIEQRARAAGFDLAGIASVPDPADAERFAAWIAAGRAGEMDYLKDADADGNLLRADLRRALPWARSVIVFAVNYNADAPLSIDPAPQGSGWIARYAWSGKDSSGNWNTGKLETGAPKADEPHLSAADYHDLLLPKLRDVEADLKQRFSACETKCYVDTGPVLERGYATRAGIGWIGKNTCIIHQQQGSWLLLGVVVTSLGLPDEAASLPAADRCGSCTRCIDACPTQALDISGTDGVRQMDATRCIAYLTIEKKGSIPEELRVPMGRHVFGCDICQDVCPWNAKDTAQRAVFAPGTLPPRRELINPSLAWLASLQGTEFARIFRGSPLERKRRDTSRRKRIRRNIAIAMGNSGQAEFLPQLDVWAAGDEPVLAETAAWAAAQLRAALQSKEPEGANLSPDCSSLPMNTVLEYRRPG